MGWKLRSLKSRLNKKISLRKKNKNKLIADLCKTDILHKFQTNVTIVENMGIKAKIVSSPRPATIVWIFMKEEIAIRLINVVLSVVLINIKNRIAINLKSRSVTDV